jgi:hypothetical protein
MAREPGNDYVDINSFLDEMVALIEKRLKAQEEAIARIEFQVDEIKRSVSEKGTVRIDKSVLKILKQ